MFKPFPFVFMRYASLHHRSFKKLELHGLSRFIVVYQNITDRLSTLREILCDTLYQEISKQHSDEVRKRLIKLKRDIQNNKKDINKTIIDAQAFSHMLIDQLEKYSHYHNRLCELTDSWEEHYQKSVQQHRRNLQQLADDELLKKGLVLSSQSLYEQIPSFQKKDTAAFRHKEFKNEYGLLLYLTRMAFKTSPFSTFTSTGIAEMNENMPELRIQAPGNIISNTRLNNNLYGFIRSLMLHHPVLCDLLLISLNNSIELKNDKVQFLVNVSNIESFQTMPVSVVIAWLLDFFKERQDISLGLLTGQLSQISGYNLQQTKSYLLKLIAAGFLEAGTGTSGIHPEWDRQLCQFFESQPIQYPAANLLHSSLLQLRESRHGYNNADASQRYHLLQQGASLLNTTVEGLLAQEGISQEDEQQAKERRLAYISQLKSGQFELPPLIAKPFLPSGIFFEDSSVTNKLQIPLTAFQNFTCKVHALGNILALADPLQPERDRMRNFFLKHYKNDAAIPVTSFYHAYFFYEKKVVHQQNIPDFRQEFPDSIQQLLLDRLNIEIDKNENGDVVLVNLTDKMKPDIPRKGSMAMFVQFFDDDNGLKGVINHFLPGMGKVAGRFVDLFDDQINNQFNEWNQALYKDHVLMELSDGSGFNANMHPPLLPWELRVPGGHNNYPANRQVYLKDLEVRFDIRDDSLFLWHTKWEKRVFTFDLSLESFYRRSNFYQLLAHFNNEYRILMRHFNVWLDKMIHPPGALYNVEIIRKPRIVFDNDVIMRRAGWVVPCDKIPIQQKTETEAAWFVRLNKWRIEVCIPAHVFLYLQSPYIPVGEKKSKPMRDDHKPQYIHFANPLLINVFKKMISRSGIIYMEEMLPHINYLESHKDQPTVTECLVHWYQF